MNVEKSIFREYDIRGIAGEKFKANIVKEYEKTYGRFPGANITPEVTEAIGLAFGTLIRRNGGKNVVIGHELRPFGDKLKDFFIEGLLKTGINAYDVGISTTPLIYFLTCFKKFDAGVNVTGSHNIYFFNGFKLVKKNSSPVFGAELQKIYNMILKEKFEIQKKRGEKYTLDSAFKIYQNFILQQIKLKKKLKVVVDCGNSTPGIFAKDFFENLGCKFFGLYLNPDTSFPNHPPDIEPPKNLEDLSKKVKKLGADIGIALDADGDRVGFVNENGKYIFSDEILLILARDALSRNKGKKILFDVKSSNLLFELVPKLGGIPLIHKTGHAPIKFTLRKDKEIIFGGEATGHFYFVENYLRIDDGFYGAAYILKLLSMEKNFSSMFSWIPKRVRTPEIKLPCPDEVKFDVMEKIKEELVKKYKTITIDGVRVVFDKKSWGLIRASNTSPYLTIKIEAETEQKLLKIKNILADTLEKFPEIGDRLNRKEVVSFTGKLGYI